MNVKLMFDFKRKIMQLLILIEIVDNFFLEKFFYENIYVYDFNIN